MKRDALFSTCRRFRFELSRDWDTTKPRVLIVMLNPSTADAERDDPTIRKCIGFARAMGLGGFTVANLYAYMATDPADLRRAGYERHPDEDEALFDALDGVDGVLCAWGSNARGLSRPREVLDLIKRARPIMRPRALTFTKGGEPAHPLMLPYSLVPEGGRSVLGCNFDALPAMSA